MRRDATGYQPKERFAANMAAIDLLISLDAEGRAPTNEERETLAQFASFGGLPGVFTPNDYQWNQERLALRNKVIDAFGEPAYNSLRDTLLSGHYTPYEVVTWMWRAMEKMGLREGDTVLDAAAGIGYFGGLRPAGVPMVNIEIDPVSSKILKHLAPNDTVINKPFEDVVLANSAFAGAITNVPFGNYPVTDEQYHKDRSLPSMSIHNFYFVKSLDKLAAGGVMAYITSAHTMDASGTEVRRAIHERGGDLIAAVRLPTNTFKAQAGTEVNTDILIFQKRAPNAEPSPHAIPFEEWGHAESLNLTGITDQQRVSFNRYFHNRFTSVLGTVVPATNRYGATYAVNADLRSDETLSDYLNRTLTAQLSRIPAGIMDSVARGHAFSEADAIDDQGDDPAQSFTIPNGSYALNEAGDLGILMRGTWSPNPETLPARRAKMIAKLVIVRDAALATLKAQVDGSSEEDYLKARATLNAVYDRFVKNDGPLSPAARAMAGDPSLSILIGIEEYDPDTKTAKKADLFSKRTIELPQPVTSAETALEALNASLAWRGSINPSYMVNITARPWESLRDELGDAIYYNPMEATWETKSRYLSGNVVDKYNKAVLLLDVMPELARNVEALAQVRPPPVPFNDITPQMGSRWIPVELYNQFAGEYLGRTTNGKLNAGTPLQEPLFSWDAAGTKWTFNLTKNNYARPEVMAEKGTPRLHVHEVLASAMSMGSVTITEKDDEGRTYVLVEETAKARAAVNRARTEFVRWLASSPERSDHIEHEYNEKVNVWVERTFDGSYLDFSGMLASGLTLRPHQVNGVARAVEDGNSLLAHCVGSGKSALMGAIALMSKRMNLTKKTMIVVPKNLLFQMPAELKRFYPAARVLIVTKEDLKKNNRKAFLYKVAANQWDVVVITKDAFGRIPLSPQNTERYYDSLLKETYAQIAAIGANDGGLKRKLQSLKSKVARIKGRGIDLKAGADKDAIYFEDLGIDQIEVDEAQYYKNMAIETDLENVAGINKSQSRRAEDMLMKAQYVRGLHNGSRGVITATATPISNSMTEMYTMAQLTEPRALQDMQIECFDDFAHLFGKVISSLEQDPSGSTWRYVERFAEFNNLPEMLRMFRSFADIQTEEMLDLPTPDMEHETVIAKVDDTQRIFKKSLAVRAANLSGKPEKGKDNVLVIGGDFRLGMIDMRLFVPSFPKNPLGRVSQAAKEIAEIYHSTRHVKGTQLVFCDFSRPNGTSQGETPPGTFSVPEGVRDELVALGVPREAIAFRQDVDTDDKIAAQQARVRSGETAVYFGSTETMGVGTNVQTRVVAMHHLDLPHRPTDMTQRTGRGKRQGNLMPDLIPGFRLRNIVYTTEGYTGEIERLKIKAKFIDSAFMDPSLVGRSIEEENQDRWEDIMAMTTDNPLIKEKATLDQEVRALMVDQSAYYSSRRSIESMSNVLTHRLAGERQRYADFEDILKRNNTHLCDPAKMEVGGQSYDGIKKASLAIIQQLEDADFFSSNIYATRKTVPNIANYMGFALDARPAPKSSGAVGVLAVRPIDDPHHKPFYEVLMGETMTGLAAVFRNKVDRLLEDHAERPLNIDRTVKELDDLKVSLERYPAVWHRENELQEKVVKAQVLEAELVKIVSQYSPEKAARDPELIEFTTIINRRGRPMLDPKLLGLAPHTPEDDRLSLGAPIEMADDDLDDDDSIARRKPSQPKPSAAPDDAEQMSESALEDSGPSV